jgi:hypothetical protein
MYPDAMTTIAIEHPGGSTYVVTIDEGATVTSHEVTVWPSDVERYAPGSTPEELLRASFEFLLKREPKETILKRFELPVIERYFSDYRSEIARSMDRER